MEHSRIYTTEPMATRALAAEIRHDPRKLIELLQERVGGESFGELQSVSCEAEEQIDIKLEFARDDAAPFRIGIEAKFDHALTIDQIQREDAVMDRLFLLVVDPTGTPRWISQNFPHVEVLGWSEVLACFDEPRLTDEDVKTIRIMKTVVEGHLNGITLPFTTPGWQVVEKRGASGIPSLVFESAPLPDGRTIRGHVQMVGRRMPDAVEDAQFDSLIGISVPENEENYFDPKTSDRVPGWIDHLRTLQREVLEGNEKRLLVSRRAPGNSQRELGRHKVPLARKHLADHTYLAKGYTDGWAIGIRTEKVGFEQLNELSAITAEICDRWFEVETR